MKEVRTIDANALKKHITGICEIEEKIDKKWAMGLKYSIKLIDNAPTVNSSLNLDNITEEDIEKFKMIWQRANSKGLLTINEERPQGRWGKWIIAEIQCPNCFEYFETDCYSMEELNQCPSCGAELKGGAE